MNPSRLKNAARVRFGWVIALVDLLLLPGAALVHLAHRYDFSVNGGVQVAGIGMLTCVNNVNMPYTAYADATTGCSRPRAFEAFHSSGWLLKRSTRFGMDFLLV